MVVLISCAVFPASAKKKPSDSRSPTKSEIEGATRLQVFLDRANFSPGKIDGRYNDLTRQALALYRESRGETPQSTSPQDKPKSNVAPDVAGLDFAAVEPVLIPYTVTDADLQSVGPLPRKVAEQAKLKFLPYRDAADAIAEKFHSDIHFLEQLNPGKMKTINAGDQIMVPNVEPFDLASVKNIKPGSDINSQAINDIEDLAAPQTPNPAESPGKEEMVAVSVDTKSNVLEVRNGEKLVAAYPVTVGSGHNASPVGEWKVRGIAKMPTFRWDKEMLKRGNRSGNFYLLRPGPRNPVGVMWIALNKKGIGIHGTNDPESIGHAASHGCVRLANWDIVRLATKIKPGDSVSIQ
ncbi:MAG TPA: L,D-transpeptidase [Candidatus Udaeobacter sp.]|nr:L,D-transpeptidase [Candidatus Udaeobacter sp.]